MRIFNADGSEAAMCGNGLRVFAKWLSTQRKLRKTKGEMQSDCEANFQEVAQSCGGTPPQRAGPLENASKDLQIPLPWFSETRVQSQQTQTQYQWTIEVAGELFSASVHDDDSVTIIVPLPRCVLRDVQPDPLLSRYFDLYDAKVPHAVTWTHAWTGHAAQTDLATLPLVSYARPIRHHPLWGAEGANVTVASVLSPHTIAIRTYERGVEEETLACGTGATAAAFAAHQKGYVQFPVQVITRSGESLEIDLTDPGMIRQTGPAHLPFSGIIPLRRADNLA
jgi:diaminopimelate epimerase